MAQIAANPKQYAHELIERLAPVQVSAAVSMLERMLDPLSRVLANAPFDDEPIGEAEVREVAEVHASLRGGDSISNEDILAGFGLSPEDFERLGQTPLPPESAKCG